ncbi:hypothetical protein NL676_035319 [Syzygium grande]|nr:hypothetical protein NL676_035319 [Syzygium grande]
MTQSTPNSSLLDSGRHQLCRAWDELDYLLALVWCLPSRRQVCELDHVKEVLHLPLHHCLWTSSIFILGLKDVSELEQPQRVLLVLSARHLQQPFDGEEWHLAL